MLVTEPEQVTASAESLAKAPLAAFDLEFLTSDRLIPALCVVQVSWLDRGLDAPVRELVAATPQVRLIDALAVDVRPLLESLARHSCAVAHAVRQDLGIIGRLGIAMPRVVDTQVMAAFANIGDQVGLSPLAGELLGVTLAKEQQWTDWSRRPLSDAQLSYAAADVLHLPAIYVKLADRLGERLAWARAESSVIAADAVAAAKLTPEDAWKNLGGLRGLDPEALAAARALATWRMRVAIELDRPLGWVLSEKHLIDLAKSRPGDVDGVHAIKGIAAPARQRAASLIEVLAAVEVDPAAVTRSRRNTPPTSARAQRWAEMLLAIVQLISEKTGVAPRLLATRADAEEAARAFDRGGYEAMSGLPALTGWRRDVLGEAWVGFLTGTLAMIGDRDAAIGLKLVTVETPDTPV